MRSLPGNSAASVRGSSELGSVLFCGLSGTVLAPEESAILSQIRPAGIILFSKNFAKDESDWIERFELLVASIDKAIGRQRYFLAIDHEGGRVHRFPPPVTRFPAAVHWGGSAPAVGQAMGRELSGLGFNLAFAPVLDVHNEPLNPVIGERAFGSSVEEVSAFAEPFRRAIEAEGVIACGKHFPGHGRTTADSHHELPVLPVSPAELRRVELQPFKTAIAGGLQMIMTAHVHYPQIDSHYPATLSKTIMTGILREELGFEGVVISDDLEMKALSENPLEENGVNAMAAGVDLLLVAHNHTARPLEDALKVYNELEKRAAAEPALQQRIEQAAGRVAKLLAERTTPRPRPFIVQRQMLGSPDHAILCAQLQRNRKPG